MKTKLFLTLALAATASFSATHIKASQAVCISGAISSTIGQQLNCYAHTAVTTQDGYTCFIKFGTAGTPLTNAASWAVGRASAATMFPSTITRVQSGTQMTYAPSAGQAMFVNNADARSATALKASATQPAATLIKNLQGMGFITNIISTNPAGGLIPHARSLLGACMCTNAAACQ